MTITAEKVDELRAIARFWKIRVDEDKRHLAKLTSRHPGHADDDIYLAPLIEMKIRELTESQRGLRKAQASLGRAMEMAGITEPAQSRLASESSVDDAAHHDTASADAGYDDESPDSRMPPDVESMIDPQHRNGTPRHAGHRNRTGLGQFPVGDVDRVPRRAA